MSVVAMLILSRPMYLNNYYITNQTRNKLCQEGYSSSPCVTNVIAKWNLTWAVTVLMTFKFQISLFGNSTRNNNEINAAKRHILQFYIFYNKTFGCWGQKLIKISLSRNECAFKLFAVRSFSLWRHWCQYILCSSEAQMHTSSTMTDKKKYVSWNYNQFS